MIKPRIPGIIDKESEMKNENERLILFSKEGKLIYFHIANGRIIHFYIEETDKPYIGDIYLARVNHVNKGMSGCFANISPNETSYLPFEKNVTPILVNRKYDGKIKEGDEIVVQIKKEAYMTKPMLLTCKIKNIDFDALEKKSRLVNKYSLLYAGRRYIDDIKNVIGHDIKIYGADENAYNILMKYMPERASDIILYNDDKMSLSSLYGLRKKYEDISERKVWLSCGGYIVIDKTEALTVIDVNSGKSDSKNNEENYLKVNIEAAKEIAYQLVSRNLSGMIIIDFINMRGSEHNTILINEFKLALSICNTGAELKDVTKLGLFEVVRPKYRVDIYELKNRMDKTILM